LIDSMPPIDPAEHRSGGFKIDRNTGTQRHSGAAFFFCGAV